MKKKTLVLGASPKVERYSNRAVKALLANGHPIVAVALREGAINDTPIVKPETVTEADQIHTVTLYVGAKHQPEYYDYLMGLKPQRILFNPGTENDELAALAQKNGIETEEACTLVLLSLDQY